MNEIQALTILKSLIETKVDFNSSAVIGLINMLKAEITDCYIFWEIERNDYGQALLFIDNSIFKKSNIKPYYFLSDLEKFDEQNYITIDEFKAILNVGSLPFAAVKDNSGNIMSYYQYWDNNRRIAVRMESDLLDKVENDRTIKLDLEIITIEANLGFYQRFMLTEYVEPIIYNYEMQSSYGERDSRESDYFDAMTDGQLGDFEDFFGSSDDIDTWSRG